MGQAHVAILNPVSSISVKSMHGPSFTCDPRTTHLHQAIDSLCGTRPIVMEVFICRTYLMSLKTFPGSAANQLMLQTRIHHTEPRPIRPGHDILHESKVH